MNFEELENNYHLAHVFVCWILGDKKQSNFVRCRELLAMGQDERFMAQLWDYELNFNSKVHLCALAGVNLFEGEECERIAEKWFHCSIPLRERIFNLCQNYARRFFQLQKDYEAALQMGLAA